MPRKLHASAAVRSTRPAARSMIALALALTVTGCTGGGSPGAQPTTSPTSEGEGDVSGAASFDRIPEIVNEIKPSVVTIRTEKGLGSGVIYASDGVIVTNQHVVARGKGADAPEFDQVTVVFATAKQATGRVVGSDYRTDLAVIRVDRTGLRAAEFQTQLPEVGELAVAVGSPLGFTESVTAGIISGLNRSFPPSQTQRPLVNLIQTDAPISPGSSGGALVNENGEVVGINELYIPPKSGAVSLGFAIPSATVVNVVEQILQTGEAQHAFFGIRPGRVTPYIAQQLDLKQTSGVLVRGVVDGSAAAAADIQQGDVIVAMAGQPIRSVEKFLAALRKHQPGDTVTVTVVRNGERMQLNVALTDRQPG